MLKKIALSAAIVALAGSAFAANPDFVDAVSGLNFKTSNNVKVAYKNDAKPSPQSYLLVSKHNSGDTYYATSNIATAIMKMQDSTKMGVPLALGDAPVTGLAAGESVFTTGKIGSAEWAPM